MRHSHIPPPRRAPGGTWHAPRGSHRVLHHGALAPSGPGAHDCPMPHGGWMTLAVRAAGAAGRPPCFPPRPPSRFRAPLPSPGLPSDGPRLPRAPVPGRRTPARTRSAAPPCSGSGRHPPRPRPRPRARPRPGPRPRPARGSHLHRGSSGRPGGGGGGRGPRRGRARAALTACHGRAGRVLGARPGPAATRAPRHPTWLRGEGTGAARRRGVCEGAGVGCFPAPAAGSEPRPSFLPAVATPPSPARP